MKILECKRNCLRGGWNIKTVAQTNFKLINGMLLQIHFVFFLYKDILNSEQTYV